MTTLLSPRQPALAAYSACRLCQHSAEHGIELVCQHPDMVEPFAGLPPVAILRAPGAACGPHAALMQASYVNRTVRAL